LDGSFVRPAAIGRADVATHAVGGAGYRLLYRPEDDSKVLLRNGMTGGDCRGFSDDSNESTLPLCVDSSTIRDNFTDDFFVDDSFGSLNVGGPHWLPRISEPTHPAPQAAELSWTKAGAYARFNVPSGQRNLTSLDWVDVRVANDPDGDGVRLDLLLVDGQGRNATLPASLAIVDGFPSGDSNNGLDRIHARALRGNLASVRSSKKVNLSSIVAVLLVARSASGRVWVIDVAASQARIQQPVVLNLPVISLETFNVPEGDGLVTVMVNITSTQPLKSPGSIWVTKGFSEGYQIDLPVGSSTTVSQIPYSYVGDKLYGPQPFPEFLIIGAIKGVVTGNYMGGFAVVEDDPVPILSVVASEVTAKEGQSLRWQLRLSAPTAGTSVSFFVIPPNVTAELSSSDVPTSWLQQFASPRSTPMPLSSLGIYVSVNFPYGETSANLILPVAIDKMAEDVETVVFAGVGLQNEPLTLVGKVPKHN
jgi:hypothetical protein